MLIANRLDGAKLSANTDVRIVEALTLKSDYLPGAILLSGPWGCGKTHLWSSKIKPQLIGSGVVYLSLFGIETIEDLKSQLVTGLFAPSVLPSDQFGSQIKNAATATLSLAKAATKNLANALERKTGVRLKDFSDALNLTSIKIDPLFILPSKLVVCLDDIERTKLETEPLLGLISYLVEKKGCRVLLIANEDKLRERHEVYAEYKEKVLWKTFNLLPDFEAIFEHFVEQFGSKNPALIALKPRILHIFERANCRNLRTLRRCLFSLAELCEVECRIDPENLLFAAALIVVESSSELKNVEVYKGNLHTWKEKADLNEEQKASLHFAEILGGEVLGFSHSLYSGVKNGGFEKIAILEELFPAPTQVDDSFALLRDIRKSDWRTLADVDIAVIMQNISSALLNRRTSPDTFFDLLVEQYLMSKVINRPDLLSDPDSLAEQIKDIANVRAHDFSRFYGANEGLSSYLSPFSELYKTSFRSNLARGYARDLKSRFMSKSDTLEFTVGPNMDGLLILLGDAIFLKASTDFFTVDRRYFFRFWMQLASELKNRADGQEVRLLIINYLMQFNSMDIDFAARSIIGDITKQFEQV